MAAADRFAASGLESPADNAFAIAPSDTVDFTSMARGIYVGTAGNIVAVMRNGAVITFSNVPAGMILPIRCSRVNSTNTTASNMVGLV